MKKSALFYFLLVMAIMALIWTRGAFGQSCSTANPCVPVTVTGTVGTTTTLLECGGSTVTNCPQSALTAFLANPTAPNAWHVLSTFPQKAATVNYNDPQAYNTTVSYAAYNTPSGGAAGPVSAIAVFQVPAQTATAPVVSAGPNIVTTGTAGPQ